MAFKVSQLCVILFCLLALAGVLSSIVSIGTTLGGDERRRRSIDNNTTTFETAMQGVFNDTSSGENSVVDAVLQEVASGESDVAEAVAPVVASTKESSGSGSSGDETSTSLSIGKNIINRIHRLMGGGDSQKSSIIDLLTAPSKTLVSPAVNARTENILSYYKKPSVSSDADNTASLLDLSKKSTRKNLKFEPVSNETIAEDPTLVFNKAKSKQPDLATGNKNDMKKQKKQLEPGKIKPVKTPVLDTGLTPLNDKLLTRDKEIKPIFLKPINVSSLSKNELKEIKFDIIENKTAKSNTKSKPKVKAAKIKHKKGASRDGVIAPPPQSTPPPPPSPPPPAQSTEAEERDDETPVFEENYHASGVLILPHSSIAEPFEIWYAPSKKKSRIDYYYGTDKTFQRGDQESYGVAYKYVPMYTDARGSFDGCWLLTGVPDRPIVPQIITPNMTWFTYNSTTVYTGTLTTKWTYEYYAFGMRNFQTVWVTKKKPHRPIRYEMVGYDMMLGSYYDHYVINYITFEKWDGKEEVFNLPIDISCYNWTRSLETSLLTNPMQEFAGFTPDTAMDVEARYAQYKREEKQRMEQDKSKEDERKRTHILKHNASKLDKFDWIKIPRSPRKFAFIWTENSSPHRNFAPAQAKSRYISSHNRRNTTFKLKANHFLELSSNELDTFHGALATDNRQHEGVVQLDAEEGSGEPDDRARPQARTLDEDDIPDEIDWREFGAVSSVKGQGICSGCYAFTAAGAAEGAWFRKTGKLVEVSSQQLVDCSWGYGNHGCKGGHYAPALSWIYTHGISTDKSYGKYLAQEGYCHFNDTWFGAQIEGFSYIQPWNISALKRVVAKHGPVAVSINTKPLSFKFYSKGVYNDKECVSNVTHHSVLIVGYGKENNEDYWLIKNSWSSSWGEAGYMKLAMADHLCGVTENPIAVVVKNPQFQLPSKTKITKEDLSRIQQTPGEEQNAVNKDTANPVVEQQPGAVSSQQPAQQQPQQPQPQQQQQTAGVLEPARPGVAEPPKTMMIGQDSEARAEFPVKQKDASTNATTAVASTPQQNNGPYLLTVPTSGIVAQGSMADQVYNAMENFPNNGFDFNKLPVSNPTMFKKRHHGKVKHPRKAFKGGRSKVDDGEEGSGDDDPGQKKSTTVGVSDVRAKVVSDTNQNKIDVQTMKNKFAMIAQNESSRPALLSNRSETSIINPFYPFIGLHIEDVEKGNGKEEEDINEEVKEATTRQVGSHQSLLKTATHMKQTNKMLLDEIPDQHPVSVKNMTSEPAEGSGAEAKEVSEETIPVKSYSETTIRGESEANEVGEKEEEQGSGVAVEETVLKDEGKLVQRDGGLGSEDVKERAKQQILRNKDRLHNLLHKNLKLAFHPELFEKAEEVEEKVSEKSFSTNDLNETPMLETPAKTTIVNNDFDSREKPTLNPENIGALGPEESTKPTTTGTKKSVITHSAINRAVHRQSVGGKQAFFHHENGPIRDSNKFSKQRPTAKLSIRPIASVKTETEKQSLQVENLSKDLKQAYTKEKNVTHTSEIRARSKPSTHILPKNSVTNSSNKPRLKTVNSKNNSPKHHLKAVNKKGSPSRNILPKSVSANVQNPKRPSPHEATSKRHGQKRMPREKKMKNQSPQLSSKMEATSHLKHSDSLYKTMFTPVKQKNSPKLAIQRKNKHKFSKNIKSKVKQTKKNAKKMKSNTKKAKVNENAKNVKKKLKKAKEVAKSAKLSSPRKISKLEKVVNDSMKALYSKIDDAISLKRAASHKDVQVTSI